MSRNNSSVQKPYVRAVGSSRDSQVTWRRDKVLKYASLGYSQSEIAEVLKVTQPTISKDIAYITKAAYDNIKDHIEVRIPYEREKAITLFENIKKRAIDISEQEGLNEREQLAALALAKDAAREIWAIQTQGEHVKKALKVAGGLQEKLDSLEEQQQKKEEQEEELRLYDHE